MFCKGATEAFVRACSWEALRQSVQVMLVLIDSRKAVGMNYAL